MGSILGFYFFLKSATRVQKMQNEMHFIVLQTWKVCADLPDRYRHLIDTWIIIFVQLNENLLSQIQSKEAQCAAVHTDVFCSDDKKRKSDPNATLVFLVHWPHWGKISFLFTLSSFFCRDSARQKVRSRQNFEWKVGCHFCLAKF